MAKNKNKKADSGTDILESPDLLREQLSKTEQHFERNKTLYFSILGIITVGLIGIFMFRYYLSSQNEKAQVDMFQAIYYYESDSLDKALLGDGNNYGFIDIIDNYSMTKAANLAHFYAGASYLKKSEYDNAIEHLSKFNAEDVAIQARAYALIGDANMEKTEYTEAANYYLKASEYKPNEFLSPQYLEKAAVAYEKLKDFESASDCYSQIIEKYRTANEYQNALKHKARLDGLAKK
jgi:tetratricopeptide (TPR) repeat protein